jgi:hypothetical protein
MTKQLTFDEIIPPRLPFQGAPSVSPGVPAQDKARTSAQRQAILNRLRQGTATNMELVTISHRFGARLKELRDAGYPIATISLGGGLFRYELREPTR